MSHAHPKSSILVAGAGGFIGGHLVAHLRKQGIKNIRAVDLKPFNEWYQKFEDVDNHQLDLRDLEACRKAAKGMEWIYNLAADMGGMGFIELHKAECMLSVLINTHMLMAAREAETKRFFYASSACVYAADKQTTTENPGLKESDAYPAMPEDGYGWEKLFSERMCRHFREDYKIETRIVRYHNVYGPHGTYDGGREKAPAAICRKVIEAQKNKTGEIEIWGGMANRPAASCILMTASRVPRRSWRVISGIPSIWAARRWFRSISWWISRKGSPG